VPHVIEAASTGRSKCRGCGQGIAAGALRFGESLPNPFGEGDTTHWFHLECGAFKRPEPFAEALDGAAVPVDGAPRLRAEAQAGIEHPRLVRIDGAERDPSGRAQCRHCRTSIAKGAWRVVLVFHEDGRFVPAGFIHPSCAQGYFETSDGVSVRIRHFAPGLGDADLQELAAELQRPSPPAGAAT
jgi:hypothetical protein